MNETTKKLLGKIEKIFDEYTMEDVEGDVLRKEVNEMINNRC